MHIPFLAALTACSLLWSSPASAANLRLVGAEAKSEEPSVEGVSYAPKNLRDNKSTTVWVEGESGSGLGSWVDLDLGSSQEINGIRLWAGVWASGDFWTRHNRPKEILLTFDDGSTQLVMLEDEMKMFDIPVDGGSKTTQKVRITIKSVYNGSTFDDTGISEVQVYNNAPGEQATVSSGSASTTYPGYDTNQAYDGLVDTMWCENNQEGDGAGEWLQVDLDSAQRVSAISIIAGNGSSFTMFRRFNYGKSATLTFSDGSTETVALKPIPLPQKVEFRSRQTESVRITFSEIVRGSDADYNDLCVSELQVLP
jgi:hypothetical protein